MALPLLMPRREWDRLRGAVDSSEEARKAQRALYREYLDRASHVMTSSWPNSIENVNKRNEEARRALAREAEQADERFYAENVRRQGDERARLMARARDRLFLDKDAPKTLLSAVIECTTLKERELQIDFQNQLKKEEDAIKRRNDEHVLNEAKRWLHEKNTKARARFITNMEHKQFVSNQMKECSERIRREKEEEIRLEQKDNEKAKQQMDEIKHFEQNFNRSERARINAMMEEATSQVARRQREDSEHEAMDEKLREVYSRYQHRLDCRRRRTEKEIQEEKIRILEKISTKLETGTATRDAQEQYILDKAVRELREREDARMQSDLRKNEAIFKDRQEQRSKFLEDEKQRQRQESVMRSWSMLNRYKNAEVTKAFEDDQREKSWQLTLQHRQDLLKLKKERDDREASELAAKRYFYGQLAERRLHEADTKVLRHAQLLREEAHAAGQPTHPLDRALQAYGRKYRLYRESALPAPLQEHFPDYAPADRMTPAAEPTADSRQPRRAEPADAE